MNILSHEEAKSLSYSSDNVLDVIRNTEQAVIKALAAGVSVGAVASFWRERNTKLYPGISFGLTTAGEELPLGERHQLYTATAIAAARVQAINECADILAEYDCLNSGMGREIRALSGGSK